MALGLKPLVQELSWSVFGLPGVVAGQTNWTRLAASGIIVGGRLFQADYRRIHVAVFGTGTGFVRVTTPYSSQIVGQVNSVVPQVFKYDTWAPVLPLEWTVDGMAIGDEIAALEVLHCEAKPRGNGLIHPHIPANLKSRVDGLVDAWLQENGIFPKVPNEGR